MTTIDFSPVAVSFQAVGTLLLSLMLAQLGRIFAWRYARTWAMSWLAMFIALVAVRTYIYTLDPLTWVAYLIGEWAFLLLLYSGCRELALGHPFNLRYAAYAIPLALAVAALHRLAMAKIGGQTGDVLGTLEQVGEILVLLIAARG